jgi:hypothetical protein
MEDFGSFLVFASFSSRAATIPSSLYAIEVAASNKVSGLCKQQFLSKLLQIPSSLCVIACESKLNCRLFSPINGITGDGIAAHNSFLPTYFHSSCMIRGSEM